MTDIEKKALARTNEVRMERGWDAHTIFSRHNDTTCEALCRAIEQHEAFRQEVSDALWDYFRPYDSPLVFQRFIIPAPEPDALVSVLLEMELSSDFEEGQHDAKWIRNKLDALGFEIREKSK